MHRTQLCAEDDLIDLIVLVLLLDLVLEADLNLINWVSCGCELGGRKSPMALTSIRTFAG